MTEEKKTYDLVDVYYNDQGQMNITAKDEDGEMVLFEGCVITGHSFEGIDEEVMTMEKVGGQFEPVLPSFVKTAEV